MNMLTITYNGLEILEYYYEYLLYYLDRIWIYVSQFGMAIQILFIVLSCSALVLLLLFFVFFPLRIYRQYCHDQQIEEAKEQYGRKFEEILRTPVLLSHKELEDMCGMDFNEERKRRKLTGQEKKEREAGIRNASFLTPVIAEIYMQLGLSKTPNLEPLCELTMVKDYLENNLKKRQKVLYSMQLIVDLRLRISEGIISVFINHPNMQKRHMARICYIIATESEPFRYLQEDLQKEQPQWWKIMLHRLFVWMRDNGRNMPQFLGLATLVKQENMAAFLIEEVAALGTEQEKARLHEFLLSPLPVCRTAALHAMAQIRDLGQEQAIIDTYDDQPEEIRREILKTVGSINSGHHTSLFVRAYKKTYSQSTRQVALEQLYDYGTDGHTEFEKLRIESSAKEQELFDELDAWFLIKLQHSII